MNENQPRKFVVLILLILSLTILAKHTWKQALPSNPYCSTSSAIRESYWEDPLATLLAEPEQALPGKFNRLVFTTSLLVA